MDKKLGLIVPYRDRYHQLIAFKARVIQELERQNIDYELIIVEQDRAKTFNRGMLLNIGVEQAKKLKCDYVIFHDVDMLPVNVDYSYCEYPIHLSSNFKSKSPNFKRIVFDEYFGGVTLFPIDEFEKINGYSNEYWGWGYEDDDLLYRCKINGIKLKEKKIKTTGPNGAALKFNGHNAFVEGKNKFDLNSPITFFITFGPDELICDHEKFDDTFALFTIPGLDLSINYNSYSRYNFEIYQDNGQIVYINSNIKPSYNTSICVTIDPENKIIKMYQDGEIIGETTYIGDFNNYSDVRKFYLGVGDPNRIDNQKFFKGIINTFSVFKTTLSDSEILTISNNRHFGLTENFDGYTSAYHLQLNYDSKFIKGYKLIDLCGNNNGVINNCEIIAVDFEKEKMIHIPHRRDCTFELLEHEENGYVNGSWKEATTRFNQLKFYNEVSKGYRNTKEDGLSSCTYKVINKVKHNKETHIVVSI